MSIKHINKLSVKIVAVIVIGFLLAGAGTKITYTCSSESRPPDELSSYCTSYEKAVMHPSDLLNNKQDSLTHFSETFILTSLASFALLSIYNQSQIKKEPRPASHQLN